MQELERRLTDRGFAPGYFFLYMLAHLDSESPMPTGKAIELLNDQQRQRYAKTPGNARYDREQLLSAGYAELVWRTIPDKSPAARTATAFSLFILRESRQLPRDATFHWTEAQLRQMIQSGFLLLPSNDQHLLLDLFWRRLGGVVLRAALALLIEKAR